MRIVKENLIPTLLILFAGLIIGFAAVPLQNTGWAESIRTEVGVEGEAQDRIEEELDGPGGIAMVIGPLIKVAVLMGIGGLLTALVLWFIGLFKRFNAQRLNDV